MRFNLIHNNNIKTFDDVARHTELEEDWLHTKKLVNNAFISKTKMRWAYDFKYIKGKSKGPKYSKRGIEVSSSGHKHNRGKHDGKKNKNIDCFNHGKPSWLVLKSAYLSRFYIIILHLKYQ